MDELYIVGDSMTRGYFGIPYTPLLKTPCTWKGYDGATLSETALNASRVLRKKKGILLLAGGTNDFLSDFYRRNNLRGAEELTKPQAEDTEHWQHVALESIRPLQERFHLVLTTLPLISRSHLEEFNTLRDSWDRTIRDLAVKLNAQVLDLGGAMRAHTRQTESMYFPSSAASLIDDTRRIREEEHSDLILTKERSLSLTIDGIHLNRRGAAVIAGAVDAFFTDTLPAGTTF